MQTVAQSLSQTSGSEHAGAGAGKSLVELGPPRIRLLLRGLRRRSLICRVPSDASAVTRVGRETEERHAGLRPGSVDSVWRRFEALYATGVHPALQLCIIHQGCIVLDRAIGHARHNHPGSAHPRPLQMRPDTPINLFSVAKSVTAMLIHKLQEQGRLDLDEPVARYFPGFERHGKQAITIRQVLTHRAALASFPANAAAPMGAAMLHDPDAIRAGLIEMRPQGVIGASPGYHALTGGFILAEVMRQVSGSEPPELLRRLIKQPMGLDWLDYSVPRGDVHRVAVNAVTGLPSAPVSRRLMRILGMGLNEAIALSNQAQFLTACVPAASLISTAGGMARFYQCLLEGGLSNGRRIFQPETVALARAADRARPSIDRIVGIPVLYSPGFMLGHAGLSLYGWNRHATFGHLGVTSNVAWARPDTGTVVALVTSGKPVLGHHLIETVSAFAALNALSENRLPPGRRH